MTKQELTKLIDRYLAGQCSEKESKLVDDFFDSFEEETRKSRKSLEDDENLKLQLFHRIRKEIDEKEKNKSRKKLPFAVKIAASILLVFCIGVFSYLVLNQSSPVLITKSTDKGQKSNIMLSDGTNIRLNSESTLIYPKQLNGSRREVTLVGEAFFDVAKDPEKPFVIHSGLLTTTVIGTSFNVQAFPEEDITVTVATGKVKVAVNASPSEGAPFSRNEVLTPSMQATYSLSERKLLVKDVELEKFTQWKDGVIHFESLSMRQAADVLERWYDVNIEFENTALENCSITGKYVDETLINVLESIKFINKTDYKIQDGNKIILSGKLCNN